MIGGVVAPIALVAVIGLAIGGVANRDLLDAVLWALAPLIWALAVMLRVLVLVIAVVAFILVSPILWLLSGTDFAPIRSTPQGSEPGLQERVREEVERTTDVPDPIRYLVVAAILITLIVLLGRFALRRRQTSRPGGGRGAHVGAQRQPTCWQLWATVSSGRSDCSALMPIPWPTSGRTGAGRTQWRFARPTPPCCAWEPSAASCAPQARRPGSTPSISRPHSPNGETLAPEVSRLTGLYDAARYGASPATEGEAAAAQDALAHDRALPPSVLTANKVDWLFDSTSLRRLMADRELDRTVAWLRCHRGRHSGSTSTFPSAPTSAPTAISIRTPVRTT